MLYAILFLVAVAQAQACCVPRAWSGTVGSLLGNVGPGMETSGPGTTLSSTKIYYDADRERIAYHLDMTYNEYQNSGNVILDYAKGVQYTFTDGGCTRTTIGSFHEACTPNTDGYDTYFGAYNVLNTTTYTVKSAGFVNYITVTTVGCVPVTQTLHGHYGDSYLMQTLGYSDIKDGISDPTVFNPPASCSQAPLIHANPQQPLSLLF